MYIHKKTLFLDSLAFILQWSLNRPELCQGGLTCNDSLDAKAMALFSLKYTIPCVQSLKDIQLLSEDDGGPFWRRLARSQHLPQSSLSRRNWWVFATSSILPPCWSLDSWTWPLGLLVTYLLMIHVVDYLFYRLLRPKKLLLHVMQKTQMMKMMIVINRRKRRKKSIYVMFIQYSSSDTSYSMLQLKNRYLRMLLSSG